MDNKGKKIIGDRINTALAYADKKQKELAAFLNVPDNTISYFCSGKRTPNTEQIIKISQFLNVSADFLLGLSPNPTTEENLKIVYETMHITSESVNKYKEKQQNYEYFRIFDKLLQIDEFYKLIQMLDDIQDLSNDLPSLLMSMPVTELAMIMPAYNIKSDNLIEALSFVYRNDNYLEIDVIRYRMQKIVERILDNFDIRPHILELSRDDFISKLNLNDEQLKILLNNKEDFDNGEHNTPKE